MWYEPAQDAKPMSSERWEEVRKLRSSYRLKDEPRPIASVVVDRYVSALESCIDEIARLNRALEAALG